MEFAFYNSVYVFNGLLVQLTYTLFSRISLNEQGEKVEQRLEGEVKRGRKKERNE